MPMVQFLNNMQTTTYLLCNQLLLNNKMCCPNSQHVLWSGMKCFKKIRFFVDAECYIILSLHMLNISLANYLNSLLIAANLGFLELEIYYYSRTFYITQAPTSIRSVEQKRSLSNK